MNAAQDEKNRSTVFADTTKSTFGSSEVSVAYRLARDEVDEELNEVAVLGYN